jgi:hypothetical protein
LEQRAPSITDNLPITVLSHEKKLYDSNKDLDSIQLGNGLPRRNIKTSGE